MYREITNQATIAEKTAATGVTARRITGPAERALSRSSIARTISAIVNTMLDAEFSAFPIAAPPTARGLSGQRVPQSLNEPAPANVGDRTRVNPVNTAMLTAYAPMNVRCSRDSRRPRG